MRKSSLAFRAGLLLLVVGLVSSLPFVLTLTGDPLQLELGREWSSPVGAVLSMVAVLAGVALLVAAFRLKWREQASSGAQRQGRSAL